LREDKKKDIKNKGIDHRLARFYMIDMLKALRYCHNVINVIHKDIKPDNIVINS
jgi:serine/threonine protein kinase